MVVHGVCPHDCYDTCSLEIGVEDGKIVSVRGDSRHSITQGFLCFKVNHYHDRLYHKDRVATPLKRVGPKGAGDFIPVSWEEALQEVANRLTAIIQNHGGEAVLPYSFAGNSGILSESSLDRRFFHAIGACTLERTICTSAADAALRQVYGARLGPDPESLPQARLILLWGSNPMATNLHEIPLLDQARAQGGEVWTIDPLKTATASRYDHHLAPRPGSDLALALGLGREVLARGGGDLTFIHRYVRGFDQYGQAVTPYTRERVLSETNISGREFDTLVERLVAVRPLLFRTGYGVQRQVHGAKTIWAISALSLILGSPQDVGGGHLVGNSDAVGIRWDRLFRADLAPHRSRVINMVQLGQTLIEATPPIRALVVYNSNPAVTAPDQGRVLEGLSRPDLFTVVHEQMLTDTTRYADFVFPAAMSFETLDLFTSYWHRYVQASLPATQPWGESVSNTEFFRRLARAMRLTEPALYASDEALINDALDERHVWMQGISLAALKSHPVQKVALDSDLRPFIDTGIPTPDGYFHLEPLAECGTPLRDDALLPGEFHFISPSRRETIKSSFANVKRVLKREEPEVLMHPDDIARLGLKSGDNVRLFNRNGSLVLPLRESVVPTPGTVVSYAVTWNGPTGTNVNQLTAATISDFGHGATFYSTKVRIERYD